VHLTIDRSDIFDKNIPENILGVYYFLDKHQSILYIGKSIDIKKRLAQHLSKGRKRLINTFHKVKIRKLNSELESLLFESQEIKKHRPIFNRRLRQSKKTVSLYMTTNEEGYYYYYLSHKAIENPLIDFISKRNAEKFILRLTQNHMLCEKINLIDKSSKSCFQYHLKNCNGACVQQEDSSSYNLRFKQSFEQILRYPMDCKITFLETATFVIIKNNQVCEFGVNNISHWKVSFPSNDELRIVNTFKNKTLNNSSKLKIDYL
jgi:DNA polymerase-3 subunit epsilon